MRHTKHVAAIIVGWVGLAGGWTPAESPDARDARVRPGLEVLLSDSLALVRGKRVGLVTNQAAVDAEGRSAVDRLLAAPLTLVALFSPEHGFRGTAAPGAPVASTTDSATGLPIYSLYGATTAPTDAMLSGLEVLLVDLQDAGARYYTYLWTTVQVMRSAGRHGIPVVVLDRPNPIGGSVEGNLPDSSSRSPVGLLVVPMRHGMTLGELAQLARDELGLQVELHVVPASGWRREMYLDETGLPFVPPSPNLRSLESLVHYPGLCLFEGTNLSVGRGSTAPFEQIGAPWLDPHAVAARFRAARLPGVELDVVRFKPRLPGDGKFADTTVRGLRLRVTDRQRYEPTVAAVLLLAAIRSVHPRDFRFDEPQFDRLAGGPALREALVRGEAPHRIAAGWQPGIQRFMERRKPYLLY